MVRLPSSLPIVMPLAIFAGVGVVLLVVATMPPLRNRLKGSAPDAKEWRVFRNLYIGLLAVCGASAVAIGFVRRDYAWVILSVVVLLYIAFLTFSMAMVAQTFRWRRRHRR